MYAQYVGSTSIVLLYVAILDVLSLKACFPRYNLNAITPILLES